MMQIIYVLKNFFGQVAQMKIQQFHGNHIRFPHVNRYPIFPFGRMGRFLKCEVFCLHIQHTEIILCAAGIHQQHGNHFFPVKREWLFKNQRICWDERLHHRCQPNLIFFNFVHNTENFLSCRERGSLHLFTVFSFLAADTSRTIVILATTVHIYITQL